MLDVCSNRHEKSRFRYVNFIHIKRDTESYTDMQGRNQLFISGGKFSQNFIRWRHRTYPTVLQLFRKRSHM